MNLKLSILSLILLPFTSSASDGVYLGGWSKHLISAAENETHNFVALEYDNWQIGGFKNSHNDFTTEVSYNYNLYQSGYWKFGTLIGLSYGYKEEDVDFLNHNKFMPIAVPYVTYTKYPVEPFVGLLGQALFISFKIKY